MRWFYNEAFSLLFPELQALPKQQRETAVTCLISYLACAEGFVPPATLESNDINLKMAHMAGEYVRSRCTYMLGIHEDTKSIFGNESCQVVDGGHTYQESKNAILTAVYALILLQGLSAGGFKDLIPESLFKDPADRIKHHIALILTCVQLASKILIDDRQIKDRVLAEAFGLEPDHFMTLQISVMKFLSWNLTHSYQDLLFLCKQRKLPEHVGFCVAESKMKLNQSWEAGHTSSERSVASTQDHILSTLLKTLRQRLFSQISLMPSSLLLLSNRLNSYGHNKLSPLLHQAERALARLPTVSRVINSIPRINT